MALVQADLASKLIAWGYTQLNALLANVRTALYQVVTMGGSRSDGHPGTTYLAIPHASVFKIRSSVELAGTWKLCTALRCEDSSVTIKARLYDLTAAAAVTGSETSDCSGTSSDYSGTGQDQISGALTLVVNHLYEVQAQKSAATKQCWVDDAYLQRTNA